MEGMRKLRSPYRGQMKTHAISGLIRSTTGAVIMTLERDQIGVAA
jgi:hypothetical protein